MDAAQKIQALIAETSDPYQLRKSFSVFRQLTKTDIHEHDSRHPSTFGMLVSARHSECADQ